MHLVTHVLSGWCVGNCIRLQPTERLCCMIAATASDLDGVGIVVGGTEGDAYQNYHHVLGHNLLFGLTTSVALTLCSTSRIKAFCIYLALFHLHLLLDFFGSGPLWPIVYLWPFSRRGYVTDAAWELMSWQNYLVFAVLLVWTVWIARRRGRTPIEKLAPRIDRAWVERLRGASPAPTD